MSPYEMPTAIRVTRPTDFVDLIPAMLGYLPTERMCAVVVSGGRLALTASVELDGATALVDACARAGDSVVLAVYTEDREAAISAIVALTDQLERAHLTVPAALVVSATTIHLIGPGGVIYEEEQRTPAVVSALQAQLVASGLPTPAGARGDVIAAWRESEERVGAFDAAYEADSTVGDAMDVWAMSQAVGGVLDPEEAAWLARSVEDEQTVMVLWRALRAEQAATDFALWRQVAALAIHHDRRGALTLAGWAAFVAGQGVGVVWALEEVPTGERTPLLWLLDRVQRDAEPPSSWEQIRG